MDGTKKKTSPADFVRMVGMHVDGYNQEAIAEEFGIASRTVYKLFSQPEFDRLKNRMLDRIADNLADGMT